MDIPKIIINNVRKTNLIRRIKGYGIESNLKISDEDFKQWLDGLIDEGKIQEKDLNDCFFEEIMYGYRRLMRVYKIANTRHLREESDWQQLLDRYNCPSLNYNEIITTSILYGEDLKVAAIRSWGVEDRLNKIEIIFLYRMEIFKRETGNTSTVYSYIPVVIDLEKKIILIKVWNKEEAKDGDKPSEQMDKVISSLIECLGIRIKLYDDSHQEVLYKMSKVLFDNCFKELPNYDSVIGKKNDIPNIVDLLIRSVNLNNYINVNGLLDVNKEIIDINEELFKLLQQVALLDYLFNHRIENLLSNTDKYISKIRFSDKDNLTASLMGEAGVKCIFDAQTFMCIRNSLDIVEKIVAIVVNYTQTSRRGKMQVKYDASTNAYLTIHIITDCYYTSEDFSKFWEIYERYESTTYTNGAISAVHQEDDAEAM